MNHADWSASAIHVEGRERKAPMSHLRPLDPIQDAEALHAIFGDPACCTYLPDPAFATVAETRARLIDWTTGFEATSWAVIEGDDPRALGRVSFFSARPPVWEAAVMIHPDAQGKGLAYHAMAEALTIMFEHHDARRIFADIDPDNMPSLRLFERLGFQREGYLRALWHTHIGIRDTVLMAMIDSDPRPF